jgi:hypothetical protein
MASCPTLQKATRRLCLLWLFAAALSARAADIERIWLTPRTPDDATITVHWETKEPGGSVVDFGLDEKLSERVAIQESATLHHVDIPLAQTDAVYRYRVSTADHRSDVHEFRSLPVDELRVAVVADTGASMEAWPAALLGQKPHLLLSAGDHVPALHGAQPVAPDTTTAFSNLVDKAPQLFRTTPWIPLLGNHDREIRSRGPGPKPPDEPVYDVEATAYRKFFGLPANGWRWHFDLPRFGLRFVAADLSHLSDMGTNWQTCHPFAKGSEQFAWYEALMKENTQPFLITLYNEKNSTVRGLEKGEWGRLIQRGSAAITGFGYFAERAEVDGFPYFNTSIKGKGATYKDPKTAAFFSEDNFLLLTFQREPRKLKVEIRTVDGRVLDTREIQPR